MFQKKKKRKKIKCEINELSNVFAIFFAEKKTEKRNKLKETEIKMGKKKEKTKDTKKTREKYP